MSYRVIVAPTADAEAQDAFDWYAERSPAAARRWYAGLAAAIASLAEGPEGCPVSEDDSEALGREVRLKLYGRRRGVYRILFAIRGDTVHVLRIRHAARALGAVMGLEAGRLRPRDRHDPAAFPGTDVYGRGLERIHNE